MSYGNIVQLKPNHRLAPDTAHAVVAAQLRGESRAREDRPDVVVAAIAREIESLGLVPDQDELRRRYAAPSGLPEALATRLTE